MKSCLTQARFKDKKRSCPLCKPHKKHWVDKRGMQQKKADVKADQDLSEL